MTAGRAVVPTWQELVERQAGVLGRGQALAAGLTRSAWQWRVRTGEWQQVLPGVFVAQTGSITDEQRAWAALVYAGEGAALTGDAALREFGMDVGELSVWRVAVPARRVVERQVGSTAGPAQLSVRVHRVTRLDEVVHPARSVPVVRVAPALLHAAAFALTDRAAEWRVASAVQRRLVTPEQVRQAMQVLQRTRRRGLVAVVLDDVELGAHAAGELDLLRLLRRGELPLPDELQRLVRTGTVRYLDAWWERQRVHAEVDGAHHRFAGDWDADLLRNNDLAVHHLGERVVQLRFSTGNLRHDEAAVVRQLRAVLLPDAPRRK